MQIMKKSTFLLACCLAAACTDETPAEQPAGPCDKPEYSYSAVEYRKWQSSGFKPWTTADAAETRTVAGMNWFSPVDFHVETPWGGRLDYGAPEAVRGAAGFFRVARADGRWYFLDPDGGAVILRGTQHVTPGESDEHKAAFNSRFGSLEKWSAETGALLAAEGINYISWGAKRIEPFPAEVRENLLSPGGRKIAYGENLYLLRTFMWDMRQNLGYAFEDGTYNRLVLVFEPTFEQYVTDLAREKCALFAGDRHFVGYYLDNELPFVAYENNDPVRGVELAHFLALPDRYRGAREFAGAFLRERGIASAEAITAADRTAFRTAVAERYYEVTTRAVRKADPEHLILGSRLHDWSKYTQGVVEACARYCDAVSVNYYARWQPEPDYMANLAAWCGERPFIVSEFYVKGDDATYRGKPYANLDGGGWLVRTQRDRGAFYENFCLRLLETRCCAGWMHFEYCDSYGGQTASNKGLVSVEYVPYTEFLGSLRLLHANLYALAGYYDDKVKGER